MLNQETTVKSQFFGFDHRVDIGFVAQTIAILNTGHGPSASKQSEFHKIGLSCLRFSDDWVSEYSNAVDFHFTHIAGLHVDGLSFRAHPNDIAGIQR